MHQGKSTMTANQQKKCHCKDLSLKRMFIMLRRLLNVHLRISTQFTFTVLRASILSPKKTANIKKESAYN